MADDLDVHGALSHVQSDDKNQQVIHYMLQDPGVQGLEGAVVNHLLESGGYLTTGVAQIGDASTSTSTLVTSTTPTTVESPVIPSTLLQANKVKKRTGPIVSQKELSKQWKGLCKKAKDWCGLHGSQVPSFVMMYLDENKLVWEGPDHMESFISDENVISAFLRTAVATGNIKSGTQDQTQGLQDAYMEQQQHGVSEAENTVVQALEQLGQMTPISGSSSSSQPVPVAQYVTASGDQNTSEQVDDAETVMHIDHDESSSKTTIEATEVADGSADGLSDVIDSVIKDWDPTTSGIGSDGFRRSSRGRRIRPPGILVDTTVGTFEIIRNAGKKGQQKSKLETPVEDVRVLSMNRPAVVGRPRQSSSSNSSQYRQYSPCPECSKPISRNNLTAHLRIHKREFRHFCDVCQKGFYTRKDMSIHYRIHTGERPFNCPICFKAFRQRSKVKEHMLTHTGHKPHVCPHCHHTFARRSDLKCHIRLHTGEKPYQCTECSKRFTQPGNFRAHLRTHTRDQRAHVFGPCDACGRTYSSLQSWKEHIRTHHSDLRTEDGQDTDNMDGGDLEIEEVGSGDQNIILQRTGEGPYGQPIFLDMSGAGGASGPSSIQLSAVAGPSGEDIIQQGDGDEIQTILIDQSQHAALQNTDGRVVMITEEQAARILSMTQQH